MFSKITESENSKYRASKLEKIDVLIPIGKEMEIGEQLGHMFEWYDDNALTPEERANYAGKCMIRLS